MGDNIKDILENKLIINREDQRTYWHSLLFAFTKEGVLSLINEENRHFLSTAQSVYVFENGYSTYMDTLRYLFSNGFISPDINKATDGIVSFGLNEHGKAALAWLDQHYGQSLLEQHWNEPDLFREKIREIKLRAFADVIIKVSPPKPQ